MKLAKALTWLLLPICILLLARSAFAGPARCSYGNQDSTCATPIVSGWQPQPQCSTAAGWTTVGASRWIGSQWTAPQCNYQAQPTCPPGDTEVSPASWNGSSWNGPACQTPSRQDPSATCTAAVPGGYTLNAAWTQVSNPNGPTAAAALGLPGFASQWSVYPVSGPPYTGVCNTYNIWFGTCIAAPNGQVAVWMSQAFNQSSGSCNH